MHHGLDASGKRRGCSLDVLINSALAEWLSEWYSDGQPKKFQEICGIVARDDFLNSAEDHLLELYFGTLPNRIERPARNPTSTETIKHQQALGKEETKMAADAWSFICFTTGWGASLPRGVCPVPSSTPKCERSGRNSSLWI